MDAFASDWLNLALRWIHVTVGIAWIGTSFFFIWLENHLRPPIEHREGVHGEVWMVHGGGFYQLQKFLVAPPRLPPDLHWFKWEAYATWISGFLLLCLIYFAGASAYLVKPGIGLAPWLGVVIALAVLVLAWILYDAACRRLQGRNDLMVGALVFVWTVAVAWGLSQVFTGRATYILVGAMLGTIMAANVLMVIIPNQRLIVGGMLEGRPPDAAMAVLGAQSKQRSFHNNYLTLPVLFTMISNHYPGTFGHGWNWAVLAGLFAIGILVRHYFNLRNRGRNRPWLIPAAAAALVALAVSARPERPAAPAAGGQVAFNDVEAVVQRRCAGCHAARPSHEGFDAPPKGVVLETAAAIAAQAPAIYAQAVATEAMPLGNVTEMTVDERALLGRWIAQGARLP
ncbi:urate hydroxylase PuuD [Arenibaculum pallidiluteum]|uniref:urate hydroxylase PuuD n=1 Tax=Arenibaculum pallidiluteum TaxID=2812559 RepID=UPI001A971715|nr:urate hydroxylase PuuD [Arenibaculum pallidiluteum]